MSPEDNKHHVGQRDLSRMQSRLKMPIIRIRVGVIDENDDRIHYDISRQRGQIAFVSENTSREIQTGTDIRSVA